MDIYGTMGPSCADVDTLEAMLRAGMTGIRLNLSHVTLPEAADEIHHLQEAGRRCGVRPKLLIDMQGPELRIGAMSAPVELVTGSTVLLNGGEIPVPQLVLPHLKPGQEVLLDDGKILLEVTDTQYHALVKRGGVLQERKSIALPGAYLYPPTMTETDLANIRLAAEYGVTGLMQPFVRDRKDLETVRRALDENGGGQIRLLAKIENQEGMAQLHSLLPAADEIVIARGDLGNAMELWELPAAQKEIARHCRRAGKPFMVVTQMLASMEHNPVPTRAEISDIFNAVLDGASSVMVTGETAVGRYPVASIRYLTAASRAAENYRKKMEE